MILACDPGLTGCLVVLDSNKGLWVYDMPTKLVKRNGKHKREIDFMSLGRFVRDVDIQFPDLSCAVIERVGSMPGQGVSSMFSFGKSAGAVLGAMGAMQWEVEEVAPATWKKHFGLIGKAKDAARLLCLEKFAPQGHLFRLKKHSGRSDAALIALWAMENRN